MRIDHEKKNDRKHKQITRVMYRMKVVTIAECPKFTLFCLV